MSGDTPPSSPPRVLVVEPMAPVATTIRRFLEAAGFEVEAAQYLDEAIHSISAQPPALVLASRSSSFDGEVLCHRVKELVPGLPVILFYPPDEDGADSRAHAVGAHAALVGPLKRVTVVTCVRNVLMIAALQHALGTAQASAGEPVLVPTEEEALALSGSGADFEFFKKLLLMEVKRSRRYRYPISLLLVGIDSIEERLATADAEQRTRAYAEALSLLATSVRDIDLAAPVSLGKFVIFLPHTGRSGALIVAERLRLALQRMQAAEGLTASVGIAAFEPAHKPREISFGTMMKDAADALKKAQSEGGDRVVAPEAARRERISLT